MKKTLFVFVLQFFLNNCYSLLAQEFTYPLHGNPALMYQKKPASSLQRMASLTDTIDLPFEDDFSRRGYYPFDSLWLDSNVFINTNYSELPVTIGVATFDGLNQYGRPYNPSASHDSIADFLTSRMLNLAYTPGDTSIWLSFYYQPQGLGDEPESGDSLILQFKDTGNVWNTVWEVNGRPDTVFQRVDINILDAKYFFKGFQFRFYNIATVNGNRDHWNLDYVTLLANSSANFQIQDFAMVNPQISLLSEFTSMPYSHYKALGSPAAAMKTEVHDSVYFFNYGPTILTPSIDISQNGLSIFNNSIPPNNVQPYSFYPYTIPLNGFTFPIQNGDSAEFLFKSYTYVPIAEKYKYNDTSYLDQHFYNYYSYDDGSAELSYGLTGNTDISMAYRFDVKVADTLRGVQIYFDPTGVDVTNELFELVVWTDINLSTNQSVELYKMINQKPDSFIGINGYKTYLFDTTMVVGPGHVWVGLTQDDPIVLYGIGLDRNTDSHTNMYCHVDGTWFTSQVHGSWMIRPLFGKKITLVSTDEVQTNITPFSLRPNPANDNFYIQFENKNNKKFHLQIFDIFGSLQKEENIFAPKEIGISGFSAGVYIVRLLNEEDHSASMQKLIVR